MPKIVKEALKLLLLVFTGVCGSIVLGLMTYGTGVFRTSDVGFLFGSRCSPEQNHSRAQPSGRTLPMGFSLG
jgi:hypothetical protein